MILLRALRPGLSLRKQRTAIGAHYAPIARGEGAHVRQRDMAQATGGAFGFGTSAMARVEQASATMASPSVARRMLGPGTGKQPADARPGHGKAAGTREVKGHSAWRRRDQPERQAAGSGQQHRYEGAGAHARVSGGIGDAHCCSSMPRRSPEGPSCSQRRRVGTHSNCLACRCTRLMSRTRTRRVRVGKMQVEWAAMWVRAWAKLSSWRGTGGG